MGDQALGASSCLGVFMVMQTEPQRPCSVGCYNSAKVTAECHRETVHEPSGGKRERGRDHLVEMLEVCVLMHVEPLRGAWAEEVH